jgi:hypothetical protein
MKKFISKEELLIACDDSNGPAEVLKKLGLSENGSSRNFLKKISFEYEIKIPKYIPKRKYELIEKKCPVCGKKFEALKGNKREKVVCSRSCSNTYFRSGENNPNYKDGFDGDKRYRKICFKHHPKKCCICGFDHIVEVHHRDCNKNNNNPENLIPLCPNHHRMFHSKYRQLVSPLIEDYINVSGCSRKV